MDAKLILAVELAKGHRVPEDAHSIEVNMDDISFYDEGSKYISYIPFDNEYLCVESWSLSVDGQREFTVEEFALWQSANPAAVDVYKQERQEAVATVAMIQANVGSQLATALQLAKTYGIPLEVDLGDGAVDMRIAHAVDWNSSSLYC